MRVLNLVQKLFSISERTRGKSTCACSRTHHRNTKWLHIKENKDDSQSTSSKLRSSTAGTPGPAIRGSEIFSKCFFFCDCNTRCWSCLGLCVDTFTEDSSSVNARTKFHADSCWDNSDWHLSLTTKAENLCFSWFYLTGTSRLQKHFCVLIRILSCSHS